MLFSSPSSSLLRHDRPGASDRPSWRRVLLAPAAAAAVLTMSGCAALGVTGSEAAPDGGEAGADGRPAVVAAFYPLAWVADAVAGDRADVENLTTPGGEPHDLELGVQQTAEVADADLIVYEAGFQPAVDAAVEQGFAGVSLDVVEAVELEAYDDREDGHAEDDHSEEDHAEEGHSEDDHAHGELDGLDPHFWQDPARMAELAAAVQDRLTELDPAGAEAYAANADRVISELEQLDQAYEQGLAQCERDVVVTNHDAFGYLTRYGLTFAPITGISPDAEPTAGDLARLQDVIADEGVTTVFYERLVSPQTARVLAQDTGVETAVLDPIEGLTDETSDEDYLSLMRTNLAALEEANGC